MGKSARANVDAASSGSPTAIWQLQFAASFGDVAYRHCVRDLLLGSQRCLGRYQALSCRAPKSVGWAAIDHIDWVTLPATMWGAATALLAACIDRDGSRADSLCWSRLAAEVISWVAVRHQVASLGAWSTPAGARRDRSKS